MLSDYETYRKGSKKYLIASKKVTQSIVINEASLHLSKMQETLISNLLKLNPLTERERQELVPRIQSGESNLLIDFI